MGDTPTISPTSPAASSTAMMEGEEPTLIPDEVAHELLEETLVAALKKSDHDEKQAATAEAMASDIQMKDATAETTAPETTEDLEALRELKSTRVERVLRPTPKFSNRHPTTASGVRPTSMPSSSASNPTPRPSTRPDERLPQRPSTFNPKLIPHTPLEWQVRRQRDRKNIREADRKARRARERAREDRLDDM